MTPEFKFTTFIQPTFNPRVTLKTMQRSISRFVLTALVLIVTHSMFYVSAAPNWTNSQAVDQKIVVPSYFEPDVINCTAVIVTCNWARTTASVPTVSIMILNVDNGPHDPSPGRDAQYLDQFNAAKKSGVTIVGYVDTSYTHRAINSVNTDIDDSIGCIQVLMEFSLIKHYSMMHVRMFPTMRRSAVTLKARLQARAWSSQTQEQT